jgi:hypothetical protein
MATFGAVLDTCVLYPMPLADTLLLGAAADLFTFHWTDDLLAELQRGMSCKGRSEEEALRRVGKMRQIFAESEVTGYRDLITAVNLPDPDDRHVLTAAIRAQVERIVTYNLTDFPQGVLDDYDIKAVHPDEFLVDLVGQFPQEVLRLLRRQAASLKRRPMTFDEVLVQLEKANDTPQFVAQIRQFALVEQQTTHEPQAPLAVEITDLRPRRGRRRPSG